MRLPSRIVPLGLLLVLPPASALAQADIDLEEVAWIGDEEWTDNGGEFDDLTDLSLEDLMNIDVEVTSVSRKAESLQDAAAAVYVITSEDIRRSGARSIPEALRVAPGLRVARLSSGRYSVSARGFSWVHADKLLVLVDGRSAYSPRFSGTEWETLDLDVETLKHIAHLRAFYDISEKWELDGALDHMSAQGGSPSFDAQYRADVRFGWRPNDDITVSLAGQGFFHDGDVELRPDFGGDHYAYETGV